MIYIIIPGSMYNEFLIAKSSPSMYDRAFHYSFEENDVIIKNNTTLIDLEEINVIKYAVKMYHIDIHNCYLATSKKEIIIEFFNNEAMLREIFNINYF